MVYIPIEPRAGLQPIQLASAIQNHDLGTLIRARDPIYGEGEFIYLLGTVGTVAGSLVIWDGQSSGTPTYQTTLAPATPEMDRPVAVAMAPTGAGQYGWYQIEGQAVAATNGSVTGGTAPLFLAGAGQVTTISAAGLLIISAIAVTASGVPASGRAVIEINRPSAQGLDAGVIQSLTLTAPPEFAVAGSPTVGNNPAITISKVNESANLIYAGPGSGVAAPPGFRGMVAADLPALPIAAPPQAATITATSANVGMEIDTSGAAVTLNLPGVSAWSTANPGALEFWFIDRTGQGATNNITPALSGGDTFVSGVTPKVRSAFGIVRLRPNMAKTGWNVA